jgi:hypothetical protein
MRPFFFYAKMKRAVSVFAALCVLASVFSACSSGEKSIVSEVPKEKFTLSYETTEANLDVFLENDSFDTILDAGPYYLGAQEPIQPVLIEYRKLRKQKINEAIRLTGEVFDTAVQVKNSLQPLKKAYVEMLATALPEAKDLQDEAREIAQILVESQVRQEGMIVTYNSIETPTENDAVTAELEFQKTMIAHGLHSAILEDLTQFTALATESYFALSESQNEIITQAAAKFDGEMAAIDNLNEPVKNMQEAADRLAFALMQINTAEHYIGLATYDYILQTLPEINEQIANAQPNENIEQTEIEYLTEYAAVYGDLATDAIARLLEVDQKFLIDLDASSTTAHTGLWFPKASAQGREYSEKAFQSLSPMDILKKNLIKGPKMAWNATKKAFQTTRKVAGAAVESINLNTKVVMDSFNAAWYGLDEKDRQDIMDQNLRELRDRQKKNRLGAPVYKEAENYFDDAEDLGKDIAEGGTEKIFGKGNTSWLFGQIGKTTVNMFTGFGKGTMKILNPDSTDGEIAEGFLDVGLSMIGGSKVIFKGSQVAKGSAKSFKIFGSKTINALEQFFKSNHIQNLKTISAEILQNKKLTKDMVKTLINNADEIAKSEVMQNQLKAASIKINQQFTELLKEGAETVFTNASKGAKESYKEFMEQSFKNSLQGYKDSLVKVLGESYIDYIDNLVANKADDMFKTLVKEYIDKGIIPGLSGPYDGLYRGELQGEDITIPLEFRVEGNAINGGLEYSMEGFTVTLDFSGGVDSAGKVTVDIGDGKFTLAGEDESLSCTLGGTVDGQIESGSLTYRGTLVGCTGTFWGQTPQVSNDPIDPLKISITKVAVIQ